MSLDDPLQWIASVYDRPDGSRLGQLLVAVHQLPDLLLQRGELRDEPVHVLEEGDDVALGCVQLGGRPGLVEQRADLVVAVAQGTHHVVIYRECDVELKVY